MMGYACNPSYLEAEIGGLRFEPAWQKLIEMLSQQISHHGGTHLWFQLLGR
jgi:hypothetical protein